MIINATELKNNLGKYLRLSVREDIIITSNGRKVAKLSAYEELEPGMTGPQMVREQAEAYEITPRKVSYEEFLAISENSAERYEYIDGEIYLLASPTTVHQIILGDLFVILCKWFQGKKCQPMLSPLDITLKRGMGDINIVQPDLMVICDLEEKLNEKDYYMGVPTLLVEIISESTRGKDLIKKLDLYMATGVSEYWLVNPLNREVIVFLFEGNDISKSATYKKGEDALSYHFSGLEVSLEKIFGLKQVQKES
jgi:prevent-host-death family protein